LAKLSHPNAPPPVPSLCSFGGFGGAEVEDEDAVVVDMGIGRVHCDGQLDAVLAGEPVRG